MDTTDLAAWVNERHAVYLRKAFYETPTNITYSLDLAKWDEATGFNPELVDKAVFTQDEILSEYRFCNVFRELDRVTKWIRENVREPFEGHPHLWFMLCIARTINWPETLEGLINSSEDCHCWPDSPKYTPKEMGEWLDEAKRLGNKIYTGAYMIRAESDPKKEWYSWTKQRYIAEIVLGRLWEDRDLFAQTLKSCTAEELWTILQRYTGWGPFMAYQAVGDMLHTSLLAKAPDREVWAAIGPGSRRGLNRLSGRDLDKQIGQAQALDEMRELVADQNKWRAPHVPVISIQDMQNCLCETDKYMRVKNGEGRPRAKYVHGRGW